MVGLRGHLLVLAGVLLVGSMSGAATIVVDKKGGAEFTEIWAAMEAARDGDTVLVKPGEYVINTPIDFSGKAILLQSQSGPEQTTIRMHWRAADPARASVVVFVAGEGPDSVLDGFTIEGGRGREYPSFFGTRGGGILCDGSSPTISRCRIRGNTAYYGSAVFCDDGASPTITSSIISGNITKGSTEVTEVWSVGGAVRCGYPEQWRQTFVTLRDCRITENFGGGVDGLGASLTLEHCTIASNHGGSGIRIATYPGDPQRPSSALVKSCIIWDHEGGSIHLGAGDTADVSYSCVEGQGVWPGLGNSSADPLFCGWPGASEVHVDASRQGPGDGSQGNPYPDLEPALGAYSYALLSSSPCLGSGEEGSNRGAGLGVCDRQGATFRIVRLAPGAYDICGLSLVQHATLLGSGAEETVVEGAVFGLRDGSDLADVTVTGGRPFGVGVASANASEIARCTISGNEGPGIYLRGASPTVTACTLTQNAASSDWLGGGIACLDGSSPEVADCTITENPGAGYVIEGIINVSYGGALCDGGSSPSFTRCDFERNVGNGILIGPSCTLVALRGCRIRQQLEGGAGVRMAGSASARFIDCILSENASGGMFLQGDSSATFEGCEISGNSRGGLGGGLLAEGNSTLTLVRCRIVGNSTHLASGLGGAVCLMDAAQGFLSACHILGNQAGRAGAAIYAGGATLTLVNCVLAGNKQNPSDRPPEDAEGGVIRSFNASVTLIHCTIAENHLQRGGAVTCKDSWPTLENCLIWGNAPDDESCGTLTRCLRGTDPLFVNPGVFDFERFRPLMIGGQQATYGDQHQPIFLPDFIIEEPDCYLRSGSPAIDGAIVGFENPTDIAGTPRPCGSGADIGAYEFCDAKGKARFRRGDSNADGAMNLTDPVVVLGHLFLGGGPPGCLAAADSDADGKLDITDGIYSLNHLFLGGPAPASPFPGCGFALDAGALTCERYEPCE